MCREGVKESTLTPIAVSEVFALPEGQSDIRWSRRVPQRKLRRLYETEARGVYDDEQLDDVGMLLYMRCRDILTIHRAKTRREVRCPRCDIAGHERFITRKGGLDEVLECVECGWSVTWRDYRRSFTRRQLNPGGAVAAFERFMRDFERARRGREKMLAIDRVIHAFHYSLRTEPNRPTRAAGVNLIEGKLRDVVSLLDRLAGVSDDDEINQTHRTWREKFSSTFSGGQLADGQP